jgi:hypothetical protein
MSQAIRIEVYESYTLLQPRSAESFDLVRIADLIRNILDESSQDIVLSLKNMEDIEVELFQELMQLYTVLKTHRRVLVFVDLTPLVFSKMQSKQLENVFPLFLRLEHYQNTLQAFSVPEKHQQSTFTYQIKESDKGLIVSLQGDFSYGEKLLELEGKIIESARVRFDFGEVNEVEVRALRRMRNWQLKHSLQIVHCPAHLKNELDDHNLLSIVR